MIRINEKFHDFVKSNETTIIFEEMRYSTPIEIRIDKKPLKNKNFLAIFVTTKETESDPFSDLNTKYLCTIDKSTLDILHFTSAGIYSFYDKFLLYDHYSDFFDKQSILNNASITTEKLLLEKLKENEEELLKTVDLSEYEEEILEKYKTKKVYDKLAGTISIPITFETIEKFYTDKNALILEYVDKFYNEENIKVYTRYAAIEKGYKEYINSLENDDVGKIRNELVKVLNNDKYKTIKINYIKPDGTNAVETVQKDNYNNNKIKDDILKYGKIKDIPIKAIESICWGRSTLYEVSEEQKRKINYTEKERIEDFINLKHDYGFPEYVYKDKEYIEKIIGKAGVSSLHRADISLLNDETFIKKIINKYPASTRLIIMSMQKSNLLANPDFIKYAIDKYTENTKYIDTNDMCKFINLFDSTLINTPDIALHIFKTHLVKSNDFLQKFDRSILNSPKIIDELSKTEFSFNSHNGVTASALSYFDTAEALLKIFKEEDLRKYISYIDQKLLEDNRSLLMLLLDGMSVSDGFNLFANQNNYYLETYKNDTEIIKKAISIVSGTKGIEKLSAILRLNPQFNQEKIYEFASENIEFIGLLDSKDIDFYFEDEIALLEDDISYNNTSFKIPAPFGHFVFTPSYYSVDIEFEDLNMHKYKIKTNKKVLEDTALYFLKKFVPSSEINLTEYLNKNKIALHAYIDNKKNREDITER